MDALLFLLVQLTMQVVIALARLATMAAMLLGQALGWLLVAAWRGWQRRRDRRRWR